LLSLIGKKKDTPALVEGGKPLPTLSRFITQQNPTHE